MNFTTIVQRRKTDPTSCKEYEFVNNLMDFIGRLLQYDIILTKPNILDGGQRNRKYRRHIRKITK